MLINTCRDACWSLRIAKMTDSMEQLAALSGMEQMLPARLAASASQKRPTGPLAGADSIRLADLGFVEG